jgi:hypothetical protein
VIGVVLGETLSVLKFFARFARLYLSDTKDMFGAFVTGVYPNLALASLDYPGSGKPLCVCR